MLASFLCTYDIGSPSFLGLGIVREISPTTGVSITFAIPFAFAVAFPVSLAFAFPFPVAPFAALAALTSLTAPFDSPYKDAI